MDFAFSAEQDEFRSVVARFVEERWPITESRALLEAGTETRPDVWKQMAGELGLQGLAVPEAHTLSLASVAICNWIASALLGIGLLWMAYASPSVPV